MASKNTEFAQMQGAGEILPRRICVYASKKTEFQCRVIFRLAGTKFFTQHSITSHLVTVLWRPLVEWLVVLSVGMKWGKQASRVADARKSVFFEGSFDAR
jgi:hypothetical protein